MRRIRVALALLVVLNVGFRAQGAAPPIAAETIRRDLKEAQRLEDQAYQHALAGRFGEALKMDREALRLRSRWLPAKHFLMQDSKKSVEDWARMAGLPGDQQKQLGIVLRLNDQGFRMLQQGKYRDAEKF